MLDLDADSKIHMHEVFMKKIILSIFLFAISFSVFAQTVAVLSGPSSIPVAYLMEENTEYEYLNCATAQIALPKLIKGEADLGFLPPNVAAKVYTENNRALLCLGICGNGNIFLITKDENFSDIKQLEGKTVACAGQGATPEYVMSHILSKKKIKNVDLDFSTPNPQIVPSLLAGKFDYAVVPEPFASVAETKDKSIKRFGIANEFSKITGGKDFPMTVLVVNKKYADSHKTEIKKFVETYENAIKRTVENPKEAAALAEKQELGLQANIAEKAIPNCAFVWIPAKKARKQIETLLKIFGQKFPGKDFYCQFL